MNQQNNLRRMYAILDDNNGLPVRGSVLCGECHTNIRTRVNARNAIRDSIGPANTRRDFVDVSSNKNLECQCCGYRSDEAQYRLRDLTQILLTFEGEEERKMMAQVGHTMYEVQGIDTETCDDFVTLRLMRASEFDYLTRPKVWKPVREVRPVHSPTDQRKWGLVLIEDGFELSNMWMFTELQRDTMMEKILKDKDGYFQIFADLERERQAEDESLKNDPDTFDGFDEIDPTNELLFQRVKKAKESGTPILGMLHGKPPHETAEGIIHHPQMASIDGLCGDIIDIVVSHVEHEHGMDLACCTNPDSDKHDNIYGRVHDEMVARLCPSVPTHLVYQVADLYSEKRSDVTEVLTHLIETGKVNEELIEHRFAEVVLAVALSKGTIISYDTLTTLFRIVDPDTQEDYADTQNMKVSYAD